jgi:hypothetical protein
MLWKVGTTHDGVTMARLVDQLTEAKIRNLVTPVCTRTVAVCICKFARAALARGFSVLLSAVALATWA